MESLSSSMESSYTPTDIVSYRIVNSSSSEGLQRKVSDMIYEEDGWFPYGSLVVATFGPDEHPQWAQPMALILKD